MTRLRGLPLALQMGLIGLHLWWVYVLAYPGTIMTINSQYRGFAEIGGDDYWLWRSVIITAIAILTVPPLPRWLRELFVGMQAAWLLVVAYLFSAIHPPITGFGAYLAFAYFAVVVAILCWEQGRDADR